MTTRRTRAQWQALIDEQASSGLPATRFCEQHGLGYASFCNWRKRLAAETVDESEQPDRSSSSATASPGFVDLASLAGSGSGGTGATGAWTIVLSLGNGVELTLSQAG